MKNGFAFTDYGEIRLMCVDQKSIKKKNQVNKKRREESCAGSNGFITAKPSLFSSFGTQL